MNRRLNLPDDAQQGDRNPPLPAAVLHKVITLFPFLRAIKLFKQDHKLYYFALYILYRIFKCIYSNFLLVLENEIVKTK